MALYIDCTVCLLWLYLINFSIVHSAIEPGYLDFDNLPDTNFSCVGKVIGGYYADLETNCQMFHVCTIGQLEEPMDIRFLCLNGTVFDQETRVCERVDEVDCSKSERFYHLNLELYGNTAPPILEESDATKPPIISSTPSVTTARSPTTTRTTNRSFYTTSIPTIPPTTHATPKVITSNQFPVHSGPDIRFNPEEINIRLTPGSPPIIKSPSSVSFQQQSFNGDSRISVTTHTSVFKDERTSHKNQPSVVSTSSTQKPKSVVSYGLQHGYQQQPHPYEFAYQQTENSDIDYHTDLPSSEYSYPEADNEQFESGKNYETRNVNNHQQQQVFSASTTKISETSPNYSSSTSFPSSIKPPQVFNYQRTDKPPTLQLPLPGFPTLPPLTFSSPAPFSLQRHFEQKRSNDHQQRPRIIVSASASVSDDSGRRLNYSLGTIGTSHIIGKAPRSYDDYKEDDVGLDPFYHDVPKVNKPRQKREVEEEENIAEEETSSENHTETVHWTPPDYVDDNYEPLTYNQPENNTDIDEKNSTPMSNFEDKNTTSIELDNENAVQSSVTTTVEPEYEYYDYVDDNYEPSMYETAENNTEVEPDSENENYEDKIVSDDEEYENNDEENIEEDNEKEHREQPSVTQEETTTEIINTDVEHGTNIQSENHERKQTVTTEYTTETATVPPYHHIYETHDSDTTIPSITESPIIPIVTETSTYVTTEPPNLTENSDTETTTSIYSYITNKERMSENEHEDLTTDALPTETYTEHYITTQTKPESLPETTTEMMITTGNVETTLDIGEFDHPTTTEAYITTEGLKEEPAITENMPGETLAAQIPTATSSEVEASRSIEDTSELNHRHEKQSEVSFESDDVPLTDAPLSKSANPTKPKDIKVSSPLPTTPITKTFFIPRRFSYDSSRSFNCFGKKMNKFYEDPRDCRLFHYCTPGYTETQVLDMKFVCDYGTYFDSDKLICTKVKPQRCK
ncbi:uncharacterized protein CBL_00418 [Carabus blaptoides fortunei]